VPNTQVLEFMEFVGDKHSLALNAVRVVLYTQILQSSVVVVSSMVLEQLLLSLENDTPNNWGQGHKAYMFSKSSLPPIIERGKPLRVKGLQEGCIPKINVQ
jgi:hypothetical protein